MSPSGYPQQPRCEEQGDREQGYKRGAKRNYFGIVLSEKFKNAFDVVLIVLSSLAPFSASVFCSSTDGWEAE